MTPRVWGTLASATQALWPTFGNHRIYQLQPAETESAPNVIRLLSAETECPPKVPIYPHSAPKPKAEIRSTSSSTSIDFYINSVSMVAVVLVFVLEPGRKRKNSLDYCIKLQRRTIIAQPCTVWRHCLYTTNCNIFAVWFEKSFTSCLNNLYNINGKCIAENKHVRDTLLCTYCLAINVCMPLIVRISRVLQNLNFYGCKYFLVYCRS